MCYKLLTRNESESDQHDSGKTLGSIVSYCNSPVSCTLATVLVDGLSPDLGRGQIYVW